MKKLIALTVALFVLAVGNVFGQTANVNVTAEVLAELDVNATDVSFGNVTQGSVAEVQANTNDIASSNASAPVAGTISVTAGAQDYTVAVTQGAVLANTGGTTFLTFTHRVFLGATDVTADVDGTGYTVTGGGNQTFDVGGQLQLPTEAGSYDTANTNGSALIVEVNYLI